MKSFFSSFGILVILVVLVVGSWFGYWILHRESVNREAEIQQGSYGRQTALVDSILDDIKEAEDPNIPDNQRTAIVDQICDNVAHLTGSLALPNHAVDFIEKECPV